jgi:hypothetical protein
MARRKELSEEELRIIKKKVNDEEAFERFFNDCYLRNLRPATLTYYKNEFHAAIKIIGKQLVECQQKDIELLILKSKELMKVTTINTRLRALRAFYNFLFKNRLIEVALNQKRAGAYIALTNQLINDAATNMAEYVPNLLAKRTFKAIEKSILRGTSTEEFQGIVPDATVGKYDISLAATNNQLLDVLLDMTLNIHPEYLQKSQFIMSRPFYNRVAKLRDASGHFYVQNGFVNGKPNYTLFGLEVVITDSLDAGDKIGQTPVLLGSLEDGYAVMVKQGPKMTMVQGTEHALRGSVGFLFDVYLDGAVYNPDALTKLTVIA